jgi:hypothetical protein
MIQSQDFPQGDAGNLVTKWIGSQHSYITFKLTKSCKNYQRNMPSTFSTRHFHTVSPVRPQLTFDSRVESGSVGSNILNRKHIWPFLFFFAFPNLNMNKVKHIWLTWAVFSFLESNESWGRDWAYSAYPVGSCLVVCKSMGLGGGGRDGHCGQCGKIPPTSAMARDDLFWQRQRLPHHLDDTHDGLGSLRLVLI